MFKPWSNHHYMMTIYIFLSDLYGRNLYILNTMSETVVSTIAIELPKDSLDRLAFKLASVVVVVNEMLKVGVIINFDNLSPEELILSMETYVKGITVRVLSRHGWRRKSQSWRLITKILNDLYIASCTCSLSFQLDIMVVNGLNTDVCKVKYKIHKPSKGYLEFTSCVSNFHRRCGWVWYID